MANKIISPFISYSKSNPDIIPQLLSHMKSINNIKKNQWSRLAHVDGLKVYPQWLKLDKWKQDTSTWIEYIKLLKLSYPTILK